MEYKPYLDLNYAFTVTVTVAKNNTYIVEIL